MTEKKADIFFISTPLDKNSYFARYCRGEIFGVGQMWEVDIEAMMADYEKNGC